MQIFLCAIKRNEDIGEFVRKLNGAHRMMQFSTELEKDNPLLFLDVGLMKHPDNSIQSILEKRHGRGSTQTFKVMYLFIEKETPQGV